MKSILDILSGIETEFLKGNTDVISLIKLDHRKVDALCEHYQELDSVAEKDDVLEQIILELSLHTTAEEELIYSLVDSQDHCHTNEAFEEHHVVKLLLAELRKMSASEDRTDAKVKVLAELVEHHVKEEESKVLPKLKGLDVNLDELGQAFSNRKEQLKKPQNLVQPVEGQSEKASKAPAKRKATPRRSTASKPAGKTAASKIKATKAPTRKTASTKTKTIVAKAKTRAAKSKNRKAS